MLRCRRKEKITPPKEDLAPMVTGDEDEEEEDDEEPAASGIKHAGKRLGGKVILIPPYQKVFEYHKKLKEVLKKGNYKIVHSHINSLSVFSLWAAKALRYQ